jgi:N5-(carboxyethyl)ornithine synthase
LLTLGVLHQSRKENEQRLALHPELLDRVPDSLRAGLRFEAGYGSLFGIADDRLSVGFGPSGSREELLAECDVVLLPKPVPADLRQMKPGAVLWGWPHCVQGAEMTQVAIDLRLTLIAWEAMFAWRDGVKGLHVFDRNNEMAGYCGVIHALGEAGMDGLYGAASTAIVLSHGSVSRGAISALLGRGYDITVYTQRPPWTVHDKIVGCRYCQMVQGEDGEAASVVEEDGLKRPLADAMAQADVIVNGILQDTDHPLMFIKRGQHTSLKSGALIVDVSCDNGMGFTFARPTSFKTPTFQVGALTYYAVDHTPSYLWQSASWELTRVVLPFLKTVMGGPEAWDENETIRRSIEVREGIVQNPKILSFQNRAPEYPHLLLG